jgi:hypothetical protein
MCCTFLEIEKALAEFDDSKVAVVVGIKRAFTKCVGLFALHKLSAFIQLLGEMNDIGILKAPITSSGLNLASIGNILKEGVISVTNVGLEFFSGVYSNITTDEED